MDPKDGCLKVAEGYWYFGKLVILLGLCKLEPCHTEVHACIVKLQGNKQ